MAENAMLRNQKLTILQQIDELKNWHKQQSILNAASNSEEKRSAHTQLEKDDGSNNLKYSMNIMSDSTLSQQRFDELPIEVTNRNATDYTSYTINPSEHQSSQTEKGQKPKFKFLRKGEGIARFRMGPRKIPKSIRRSLKLSNDPNKFEDAHMQDVKMFNKNETGISTRKDEALTLEPPNLKLNFKNWKAIFESGKAADVIEKAIDNNQLDIFQPNSSVDSSTASIMEKLIEIGRKHIKESEELRLFETVEKHVLDSSFASTSSYVAKLMENAVNSTPVKKPFSSKNNENAHISQSKADVDNPATRDNLNVIDNKEQERVETLIWSNPYNDDKICKSENLVSNHDLEQSLHVRFAEEVDYRSFAENSRDDSLGQNLTNYNTQFDEDQEWKDDSEEESICCSHCSSTNSEDPEPTKSVETSASFKNPEEKQSDHKNNSDIYHSNPGQTLDVRDLKTDHIEADKGLNVQDVGTFLPVIREKMKELENEMEIFRSENKKIIIMKERLEKERKQFELEKKKLLKEVEDAKKKNAQELEEEKQKLAKEKFIFEKYSKSLSKTPTKEERKEIQALREQLNEMKEELNKKESRWGAAQARVRNQVKLLEEDNKKLKEEIEILRKKSRSLEILTHKKNGKMFNNTKLIHAINDHISNIPVEQDDKKLVSSPAYFNSPSNTVRTEASNVNPKPLNTDKVVKKDLTKYSDNAITAKLTEPSHEQSTTHENHSVKNLFNSQVPLTNEGNQEGNKTQPEKHSTDSNNTDKYLNQDLIRETANEDGTTEKVYSDGRKEIRYKNGNLKKIDPINGSEKIIYFNGDVKEISKTGMIKYYFAESRIWHTTLPDGLEMLDFPNGQVEKRHTSGMTEITYPNNCKKVIYPDNVEEIYYSDGTTLKIEPNKRKTLCLPNGQKEIHTDECIRREYPDGTVKVVYPDGTTETVYSNGRVRLKDKHGNLVMDSGTFTTKDFN